MIKLDMRLLKSLGYGALTKSQGEVLLKAVYDAGETVVGNRLAERMTNAQLDEFEAFYDAKDDNGAFRWLQREFPDYKEIVAAVFDEIFSELESVIEKLDSEVRSTHQRGSRSDHLE